MLHDFSVLKCWCQRVQRFEVQEYSTSWSKMLALLYDFEVLELKKKGPLDVKITSFFFLLAIDLMSSLPFFFK